MASTEEQMRAKQIAAEEKRENDIYNNFATPLIGTYLNLPKEPVVIKCPSCGITEQTQVENELKWWANEINRIFGCLFITFCCCCCFNYYFPCKQTDRNHYCKNCGCYFGRYMKHRHITPKKK
ncbi:uncharacterized protein LOC119684055 [Teleopsis dalmanni]|uniref:uncharacterized protein LOC119684055 n=1 Tax=Teleopsis dalmanni TaxID=139649 RepID=UPI0018CDE46B|nr:uncharacterized protein LOC119684055 [Teleopsis dalmanni]